MRIVVQRVLSSQVRVDDRIIGRINKGFLIFFAVHINDTDEMIEKMANKILKLRIFEDSECKMNLSLEEVKGEVLLISQFTLYANTKKGNRPSFIESAKSEKAEPYYEKIIKSLKEKKLKVETGQFGAEMKVDLVNDGPLTIIIDL